MIKLLPGNADIYVAHTSWAPVTIMMRVFKRYDLPFAMSRCVRQCGSQERQFICCRALRLSSRCMLGFP